MKRARTATVVFLVIFFLPAATAIAAVPRLINYQGKVTDDAHAPLDGSHTMIFRLYSFEAAESPILRKRARGQRYRQHRGYAQRARQPDRGVQRAARGGDDRSGSHNGVMGSQNNYSSYGGLVVGYFNTATGQFASVSGGSYNTASGLGASVSGGEYNTASGDHSFVGGGEDPMTTKAISHLRITRRSSVEKPMARVTWTLRNSRTTLN